MHVVIAASSQRSSAAAATRPATDEESTTSGERTAAQKSIATASAVIMPRSTRRVAVEVERSTWTVRAATVVSEIQAKSQPNLTAALRLWAGLHE